MVARFLIAAPIAMLFVGAAANSAPAANCTTTPAQLRAIAAASTDANAQRKALTFVATGEKLCADNANFEAGKKFAAAAKTLNVDVASLPAVTVSAQ